MNAKQKIEKFFNLSFEEVISKIHWENQKSINWISNQVELCRKTISNICAKENIKIRCHKDSTAITKNRGEKHWAFGKTKFNSELHKRNSERMKTANPSLSLETRTKSAKKRAEYFRKNPLEQELHFKKILKQNNVDFMFQYPIGPYVIDFFIPNLNLCIEIDSTNKWTIEKKENALKKDIFLRLRKFKIVRINKNKLSNKEYIQDILYRNNIICHI